MTLPLIDLPNPHEEYSTLAMPKSEKKRETPDASATCAQLITQLRKRRIERFAINVKSRGEEFRVIVEYSRKRPVLHERW
jgi:hypothetical protein